MTRPPLWIHHFLAPARLGGMESVVADLCLGLLQHGHHVSVTPVTSGAPGAHPFVGKLEHLGVRVLPIRVGDRAYVTEAALARALLQEERPDVVHTHGFRPDLLEGRVARRVDIPRVTTVHGFTALDLRTRLYRWLQLRAFRSFDGVVAVSAALARELAESGVPAERIHEIPNARPTRVLLHSPSEARRELSVSPDAFHVGWIGRLSREKGPDVFLRSLSALSGRHAVASVVGDGPMAQELRLLAVELGLDGMVRWHGEVPDARKLMRAFDVVVLSSRTEGTPVVLMEAIDAGVPVIATRVGGVPDVISPQEGTLVPPEQPHRLGEALQQMMREPDEARDRARRALRRLVSAGDTGRWIHRYEAVYREALDRHQGNGVRS